MIASAFEGGFSGVLMRGEPPHNKTTRQRQDRGIKIYDPYQKTFSDILSDELAVDTDIIT